MCRPTRRRLSGAGRPLALELGRADAAAVALDEAMAALKEAQAAVAAAEEPIDIQSVSEGERRLQEMSIDGEEEVQAPTPREPEDARTAGCAAALRVASGTCMHASEVVK